MATLSQSEMDDFLESRRFFARVQEKLKKRRSRRHIILNPVKDDRCFFVGVDPAQEKSDHTVIYRDNPFFGRIEDPKKDISAGYRSIVKHDKDGTQYLPTLNESLVSKIRVLEINCTVSNPKRSTYIDNFGVERDEKTGMESNSDGCVSFLNIKDTLR